MGRFADMAEALGETLGEVMDDADQAARLAALERSIALGSRYEPAHDPQDRDAQGQIICCECAGPIDPRRLALLPHAIRCGDCQRDEGQRLAAEQRRGGRN